MPIMTVYVTTEDYATLYHGRTVEAAEFDRLALRASEKLDQLTAGRIRRNGVTSYDTDTQERIKLATCALLEGEAAFEAATGNGGIKLTGERIGSYSYTADAASTDEIHRRAEDTAMGYLWSTGLIYQGVGSL